MSMIKTALAEISSPHRVTEDGKLPLQVTSDLGKSALKDQLAELSEEISDLQRKLYADGRFGILILLQGLDAAGKDSTVRHVFSATNPTGLRVTSFKRPTPEELSHNFLWRHQSAVPERGMIRIHNRSHYEEVMVVRVHPEFLAHRDIDPDSADAAFWRRRMQAIEAFERHLSESGTVVLKFWLKHSREEQRQRFLKRLTDPEKYWKFAAGDVAERAHWDHYMQVYEDAVVNTSKPFAPWFVVPADDKRYLRVAVADVVCQALKALGVNYPPIDAERREMFEQMTRKLESEA
ncbi:MAG: PPK2 family polyphosphate--nucleotide phosphotransferase [Lysobacteraceae bacterium]|nr:MAG: PPK2 family polyphosphate--nucleotide phosphotransferase [Xanthomonadaceae bacterium]